MSADYALPQLLRPIAKYFGRKFSYEVSRMRLPNGTVGEYGCVRHPGGALIVPVTDDGKLVLVKQYRFAMQGRIFEFPAGTIEDGEESLDTVKHELPEEAGYDAKNWQFLGKFPICPGYSDEWIFSYLATGLTKLENPPAQDEDEDIEVVLWTPAEFEEAIKRGDRIDAKTIASFYLAKSLLDTL
ncbi:NUDIX hydrolase [[Leptolyngbya] sp. PCC 7376]|uniref:NUDIX hydrolase n=1 Tax=[Leptolyngbya] sp. PCC 7376 TaxID=111781 RepID=UPI00029F24EC|nr:NUDIX hydrolase [[Leptolyngbya] sp. PCC 7376]AFY36903.1 NUDIX hydrolase [[Leptolyngbya] sp. PCC 7376]